MILTVEQILGSAMKLPESQRLELAEAIFAASEPPAPEPSGEAWTAELRRRSDDIDMGKATLTPWAEVRRRVRARIASRAGG